MPGLILKLRPHEAFMVNGVVVENGDRRARLRIKTDGANILRLRNAMPPEEATTPLKQAYYLAQRAVAGEIAATEAADILLAAIETLKAENLDEEILHEAQTDLHEARFYPVMRAFGRLIEAEQTAQA